MSGFIRDMALTSECRDRKIDRFLPSNETVVRPSSLK
jgi:hypothetical protein